MQRPTALSAPTRPSRAMALIIFLIIAAALWLFATLAHAVMHEQLYPFDPSLLAALRQTGDPGTPIGGYPVALAMRGVTLLGGNTVLTLVTIAALVFLLLRRQPLSALLFLSIVLLGQSLSHYAKSIFARPRPDIVPHLAEVWSSSFPSGHTLMATVVYLGLALSLCQPNARPSQRALYIALAVLLALTVGISRVLLGVHWPTDVLAGWALGTVWVLSLWLLVRMLARLLRRRAKMHSDQIR